MNPSNASVCNDLKYQMSEIWMWQFNNLANWKCQSKLCLSLIRIINQTDHQKTKLSKPISISQCIYLSYKKRINMLNRLHFCNISNHRVIVNITSKIESFLVGQIAETIVHLVIQASNLAQMWKRTYFFQNVRYPTSKTKWWPIFKMAATGHLFLQYLVKIFIQ